MHDQTCEVCGQPFKAARSDAKTCSDACRAKRSRRRRDPDIGTLERRIRQRAGLNAKYSYRQREQARRALTVNGLLGSAWDRRDGRTEHGGASAQGRWTPADGWWRDEPWQLGRRRGVCNPGDPEDFDASIAAYVEARLALADPETANLPRLFLESIHWRPRYAIVNWDKLNQSVRYETAVEFQRALRRFNPPITCELVSGAPESVARLKEWWSILDFLIDGQYIPCEVGGVRLPSDAELARDAVQLAKMADVIREIAIRMQLRFPPTTSVIGAVEVLVGDKARAPIGRAA
jgi:hypothetical protein